ncbi:hypothetical protein yc1106_00317 [Curvularia clavata]|uniref:Uncharacterized protein n=1 Tax=Curvularia clavata TaxID=95742 RepID=A0A9Q9DMZ1_CURCL|nr:hypothetical protein yc1106_00317 [Curvularia clavata]
MGTAKNTEQARHTTLPSPVRACTTREVEIGQYPIPQIQGVVPGIRRFRQSTSSSPSCAHSHVLQLSTANKVSANKPFPIQDGTAVCPSSNTSALQNTHSTTSRRSNYPRASPPPVFLYPVAIVPYTFPPAQLRTEHTRRVCTEVPQQSIHKTSPMQRSDGSLATSLPTSLNVIFLITLAIILLGVIWSVINFCISFPPGSWKIFRTRQQRSERSNGAERPEEARRNGIELQVMNDNTGGAGRNAQPPLASTRRHAHTSQDDNPFTSRSALSAASSPYNPFLDPPAARVAGVQRPRRAHKVRSSKEWKEAHAAFFGGTANTAKSSSTDEVAENGERKVDGKEAVEEARAESVKEQKEDKGDQASEKDQSDKGCGDDGLTAKGVKWVNETLDMLDGAVGEAAAGIAKSTDDKKVD